jgi:hypothetical protein
VVRVRSASEIFSTRMRAGRSTAFRSGRRCSSTAGACCRSRVARTQAAPQRTSCGGCATQSNLQQIRCDGSARDGCQAAGSSGRRRGSNASGRAIGTTHRRTSAWQRTPMSPRRSSSARGSPARRMRARPLPVARPSRSQGPVSRSCCSGRCASAHRARRTLAHRRFGPGTLARQSGVPHRSDRRVELGSPEDHGPNPRES